LKHFVEERVPLEWFNRLADVPGVMYEGSQTVDRTVLPGHDLEPVVEEFEIAGELHRSILWTTPEGIFTSASPVQQRGFGSGEDATPREALRRLEETLELPGEIPDYHFAIQNVYGAAYKGRREDPLLLKEVERLCWLDINLVESYPQIVESESGKFARVLAYERLVRLYEGEGYFREALEVAERSLRMGQEHLSDAVNRLRSIRAEREA
jgi:hypothetical protein